MKKFENCFAYNDHLKICLNKIEMYDIESISAGLKSLFNEAKKDSSFMNYFVCGCRSLTLKYKDHHYKDLADLFHSYKRRGLKLIKGCYF